MKKHTHLFLDIYNVDLHIAVTREQVSHMKSVIPSMHKIPKKHPPSGATSAHNGTRDGAASYHICFWIDHQAWVAAGSYPSKLAEICAHEAAHGAGMIWRHIGAEIDHDTLRDDEPMAYLIGWLTEQLFRCAYLEGK